MSFQILKDNPWLEQWKGGIEWRNRCYIEAKNRINEISGSLDKFTLSYKEWGLNRVKGGISYKEWAPGAKEAYLAGDFNNWKERDERYKCTRDNFGHHSLFIEDVNGEPVIKHGTHVRVVLVLHNGNVCWRVPAWITYAIQNEETKAFNGCFWNPPEKYVFKHPVPLPKRDCALLIYETHIGMAGVEPRVHTYKEFERDVLPMVKENGYNAIQIMAIMEHPYYGSFGYQVSSFFAVSSRFGTPEELKSLVDTAHSMGISVLLDLVHSHAAKNVEEGLNQFDGTDHHYFHEGGRGYHPLWDSRLFNYSHPEVQRFLLSNLRFYLEEYRFDGFRFDGVTSMMYLHHGNLYNFTSVEDYFNSLVDYEAITYLMLANDVIHMVRPDAITIAEDVSGMCGVARSIKDGGIGFDYRLAMAVPDMWIKILKEQRDEDWNIGNIAHTLSNRPYKEKTVGYCESHDQALVGDKTIAFWLMDKEMYDFMSTMSPPNMVIDRGLALHKMIRLVTFGLSGEAYLNFMGNEFGHPEWIDFPRADNGWSYHHCRRRFDLAKESHLKYKYLLKFDQDMLSLEHRYKFMEDCNSYISVKHDGDKVMAFERYDLLFLFNFNSSQSFEGYAVGIEYPGSYRVVLCTDDNVYGGFDRISKEIDYNTIPEPWNNRKNKLLLYLPARTAYVLKRITKS